MKVVIFAATQNPGTIQYMSETVYVYPRTELRRVVWSDVVPAIDPDPFLTPHGRLIPGPAYAKDEFSALLQAVQADTLPFLPLPSARQLARISINSTMGCWELPLYNDSKSRARYGSLQVAGIVNPGHLAHRAMFIAFHGTGPLPNGPKDLLDHLCENKACCYPRHLEVVNHTINTMRGRLSIGYGQLTLDEF